MLAWRSSRLSTVCFFVVVATLLLVAAVTLPAAL